jgi:hypothetical protein
MAIAAQAKQKNQLRQLLEHIAHQPTTADLWKLRGSLLACAKGQPTAALAHDVAREFFLYLSELQSKLTARQYNEVASRLDIGSVGMLALQDILVEQKDLWKNLLLGGIGEGLMVLASRQYIKAWEKELEAVHRRAAWTLYGVLWDVSCHYQPQMPEDERQAVIEAALEPALDEDTPFEMQMLLLLRFFQSLVLLLATPLCNVEQ